MNVCKIYEVDFWIYYEYPVCICDFSIHFQIACASGMFHWKPQLTPPVFLKTYLTIDHNQLNDGGEDDDGNGSSVGVGE